MPRIAAVGEGSHAPARRHYRHGDLRRAIRALLAGGDMLPFRPSPADLGRIDQFHPGGRGATAALARAVGLGPADRVLDLGCGLGGPARQLAAEAPALVVGIDQSEEYVTTAQWLGQVQEPRCHPVAFVAGDATALPFRTGAFSVVWSQHVQMNIADKPGLYAELRRVLAPGGRLALYEPALGGGAAPDLPLPWARESAVSHLETVAAMRAGLTAAGFIERQWQDVTGRVLAWLAEASAAGGERRSPALSVLLGADAPAMLRNLSAALVAGRLTLIEAVLLTPGA